MLYSENKIDVIASYIIIRAWESLSDVTCCRSLVVIYDGIFILQIGFAKKKYANGSEAIVVDVDRLMQGSLYSGAVRSGSREIYTFKHLSFLQVFDDLVLK